MKRKSCLGDYIIITGGPEVRLTKIEYHNSKIS